MPEIGKSTKKPEVDAKTSVVKDDQQEVNEVTQEVNEVPQEAKEKPVRKARKRVPLGTRNVLTAPKKQGYRRRFVNDFGDRVDAFKEAGWNVVTDDVSVGDDKIGKATSMGSSANPSVGGGQRAVLMEIPEEYFLQDAERKQSEIDEVEREIVRTKPEGMNGKVNIS